MNPILLGFLVFVVITFLLFLWVFIKNSRRKGFAPKELQYIKSHWIRVIDTFPGNPAGAIMDADKILDYALAKKGFQGTLGEKLKKAGPRFSNQNNVWSAHKLRNKLAHELGGVDVKEAKRALVQFKQALNDLGANL